LCVTFLSMITTAEGERKERDQEIL
jgi:hypothetical protein